MKNKRAVLAAACAVILVGSVASAAIAIQQKFTFSRDTAFASFSSTDDPCVLTSASILGSISIVKVPGDPSSTSSGAFGFYTAFDTCTQNFVLGNPLGDGLFTMNGLGSATVSVTLALSEFIFDPDSGTYTETPLGSATMDAQWTDFGKTRITSFNNRTVFPNGFVQDKFTGRFRDATVEATLELDGEDLLAGLSVDNTTFGHTTVGQHIVLK